MRALAALERFLERLLERPSARLFHVRLEPVQVLRKVERAMETGRRATAEGTIVPDRYLVRLDPSDIAGLDGAGATLAADLADGALRFARAHGYRLLARPRIDLVPDPQVASGDVAVEARFDAQHPSRVVAASSATSANPEFDDGPDSGLPGPVDGIADANGLGDATRVYAPPRVVGPLARLRVMDADGGDRIVVVDGSGLSIGRDPTNDVVLVDGRVSRRHARLQVRQGTLMLVDLGSSNGTLVNGAAVGEVTIGVGDEIRIGATRLLVEGLSTT